MPFHIQHRNQPKIKTQVLIYFTSIAYFFIKVLTITTTTTIPPNKFTYYLSITSIMEMPLSIRKNLVVFTPANKNDEPLRFKGVFTRHKQANKVTVLFYVVLYSY